MNDTRLRELLHDTQPPAFDASGVATGARLAAHRRVRNHRALLGGVTGVAVVAVALPMASQLFGDTVSSMTASEADDVRGGAAPEVASAPDPADPVDASDLSRLVSACDAPQAPSGPADPTDLTGLVVCGPAGPRELSASDFSVVRDDMGREVTYAGQELTSATVTVLGRLASGDLVFLRLTNGRLDFGTKSYDLGRDALAALEAAAR